MQRVRQCLIRPVWVRFLAAASLSWVSTSTLMAQAPGVKIVRDRSEQFDALVKKANEYRRAGELLSVDEVQEQLSRTHCSLKLPQPATQKLSDREIWRRSQAAHVRVGWHYLCTRCDHWHQNLAGGYFITPDGVIATCYHLLDPEEKYREGYLVAANEKGELFPVTEVLAADERADAAILRAKTINPVTPLALNTNVYPGDAVWCYSDPLGRSGYFSKGMVNRFYVQKRNRDESVRMEVSTDWAEGSSGAAVVDECGNAIGHVSEVSTARPSRGRGTNQISRVSAPAIVFHCAARAADVIALVKPTKER